MTEDLRQMPAWVRRSQGLGTPDLPSNRPTAPRLMTKWHSGSRQLTSPARKPRRQLHHSGTRSGGIIELASWGDYDPRTLRGSALAGVRDPATRLFEKRAFGYGGPP